MVALDVHHQISPETLQGEHRVLLSHRLGCSRQRWAPQVLEPGLPARSRIPPCAPHVQDPLDLPETAQPCAVVRGSSVPPSWLLSWEQPLWEGAPPSQLLLFILPQGVLPNASLILFRLLRRGPTLELPDYRETISLVLLIDTVNPLESMFRLLAGKALRDTTVSPADSYYMCVCICTHAHVY